MNDYYLEAPTYGDAYAKRHILCLEIGYTLGLDHVRGKTCMDDRRGLFAGPYVDSNAHDYEQLETIYDHPDNETTADVAGTEPIFTAQELELVVPSAEQAEATSVLIKDFGGGRQLVTHILRVDDFAAGFPAGEG